MCGIFFYLGFTADLSCSQLTGSAGSNRQNRSLKPIDFARNVLRVTSLQPLPLQSSLMGFLSRPAEETQ
jgi:hypothetical protein